MSHEIISGPSALSWWMQGMKQRSWELPWLSGRALMDFIVEAANVGCVPKYYFRPIGTFSLGAGTEWWPREIPGFSGRAQPWLMEFLKWLQAQAVILFFRPISTFTVGAGEGMVALGITWALGQRTTGVNGIC